MKKVFHPLPFSLTRNRTGNSNNVVRTRSKFGMKNILGKAAKRKKEKV